MTLADCEQHRFGRFGMDFAAIGPFAQHLQKGFVIEIAKCYNVGWFICHGISSRDLSSRQVVPRQVYELSTDPSLAFIPRRSAQTNGFLLSANPSASTIPANVNYR